MYLRIQSKLKKPYLDSSCKTKRTILQTCARNFDPNNYLLPLLNRAKLYLQSIQNDTSLGWDEEIEQDRLKEWVLTAEQLNRSDEYEIDRYIGPRNGKYTLLACTDASRSLYGVVVYIMNNDTGEKSLLLSKNKVVTKSLNVRSIPALEFHALTFGVETLIGTYKELTNPELASGINITDLKIFSDSMVSLHWLQITENCAKSNSKLDLFVRNRLNKIHSLCEYQPVNFNFIEGSQNPADVVSRPTSSYQLSKSSYFHGPDLEENTMSFTLPCVSIMKEEEEVMINTVKTDEDNTVKTYDNIDVNPIYDLERSSKLSKVLKIYNLVYKFVNKLKCKVNEKNSDKLEEEKFKSEAELCDWSFTRIILEHQDTHFKDCHDYLRNSRSSTKHMPDIMAQLNIFKDKNGLLRVKSKFDDKFGVKVLQPILLNREDYLTSLLINDIHEKLKHSGKYVVLNEFRKQFYTTKVFSKVKSVLNECLHCRRFNSKPVSLNQSDYRDFRVSPEIVPFRSTFIDHFGPIYVKMEGVRKKVYVLLLTCLFTRAVHMIVSRDLSTDEFLIAFQKFVYTYGLPAEVYSDLGTSIVSGGNVIKEFLKDYKSKLFMAEKGIKELQFEQYYAGNSSLGGVVESMVKLAKRLIFGSIKNNVIDYFQFESLVVEINHLINKRPVAFENALRDTSEIVPRTITPELLLHGYDLPTINCVPNFQPSDQSDPDYGQPKIKDAHAKLQKIRENLIEIYQNEFLAKLFDQAIDDKDRYKPKRHQKLKINDIILLKEIHTKPQHYPLARVIDVTVNRAGEVTGVKAMKGNSREIVRRHTSAIVHLLSGEGSEILPSETKDDDSDQVTRRKNPPRKARANKRILNVDRV